MKATVDTYRTLRHFSIGERWGEPLQMDVDFLLALDEARQRIGRPFHIHSAFRPNAVAPSGRLSNHALGLAADLHIDGLCVVDQFLAVERIGIPFEIGLYPHWPRPGLHLALQAAPSEDRWIRFGRDQYMPLNAEQLGRIVCLEAAA